LYEEGVTYFLRQVTSGMPADKQPVPPSQSGL
jgi:hypothetical protein